MNSEVFPVSALAKQLDSCNDSEFQTILQLLRSPAYVNEQLLKSELGLLGTKILALTRSSDDYSVWKGCHTAIVICAYNPLLLCSHGGQFLAAIYSKFEQKVDYYSSTIATPHGKVLLEALVYALSSIMHLMRDKPTLSREGLVPKLKVLIPSLITLAQFQPKICLPVLKTLLYKHSTTFKPFGNKFRKVLTSLICKDYQHFDGETQKMICDNYAYLHLIKLQSAQMQDETQAHHKTYQDENWRVGIFSILSEFKPIIELCDEVLDLDQDKELRALINSISYDIISKEEKSNADVFLSGLKLDMNAPLTFWEIPRRLNLLVDILSAFLSLPTPYPVRIPIGACNSICEALLSMTRNYLPLKRHIRHEFELTSVLSGVLPQIQFVAVRLYSNMASTYGKCCLSMLPSILGSLELFIPLQQKSTKIDFEKCRMLKSEFLQVFHLANQLFPHVGHQLQEIDLFNKLIDVALYLSEDVSLVDSLFSKQSNDTHINKTVQKKKSKKELSSGALSDLYTNPDKFNVKNPHSWYDEMNLFLRGVLSNWKLTSNQQVRIIKYSISYSLHLKQEIGYIPESFVRLLRTEVIYPGNERVSILPIAVSLLKQSNDEVFDLLCHPRLPMGIIHQVNKPTETEHETHHAAEELEQPVLISDLENVAMLKNDLKVESVFSKQGISVEDGIPQIDETKIFKKRNLDEEPVKVELQKRSKLDEGTLSSEFKENTSSTMHGDGNAADVKGSQTDETQGLGEEDGDDDDDDDSEFEIPDIHLSEDEDDEDGEEEEEIGNESVY